VPGNLKFKQLGGTAFRPVRLQLYLFELERFPWKAQLVLYNVGTNETYETEPQQSIGLNGGLRLKAHVCCQLVQGRLLLGVRTLSLISCMLESGGLKTVSIWSILDCFHVVWKTENPQILMAIALSSWSLLNWQFGGMFHVFRVTMTHPNDPNGYGTVGYLIYIYIIIYIYNYI
jgi:hypothetical protein